MQVRVLFFGQLKDIVGRSSEDAEVAPGETLGDLFARYRERFPRLNAMASSIVLARNQEFSHPSAKLTDSDEVAFLPPVSGGSGPYSHVLEAEGGHFFALTRDLIDLNEIRGRILRPEDGAVVHFEGVVRNNSAGRSTRFLDYECYEALAIKAMRDIGVAIAASHAVGRVAMVHRLGRLQIGEASVLVAVTAPHRKPAFDAALEGINRLKKTVPIWKKEHFADGEVWVEGDWDPSLLAG